MVKRQEAKIPVTAGSDNVFADLGFDQPEEELTKAKLAGLIWHEIERQGLTQAAAASLMGIDQPKVSALMNGRLANFSSERLMRLLTALGQNVEIVVTEKPPAQERGRILVVDALRHFTRPVPHAGAKPMKFAFLKAAAEVKASGRAHLSTRRKVAASAKRHPLGSGSRSPRKRG
jgi:predicted XRE-type DNA-binding protein